MAKRQQPERGRPREAAPQERKDWRRSSGRNANRGHGKSDEAWQAGTRPSPRYSQYRYLLRMIVATAVLVVLLGTWFFYVIRRHNQVPLYAIVITDYQSPYDESILPPNALAGEDLELFEQMFRRNSREGLTRNVGLVKLQSSAGPGKFNADWMRKELTDVLEKGRGKTSAEPGGPHDDVVMFYISAHGAVNAQSEPCLLMTDSDPLDCTTWVRLRDVLSSINDVKRFRECKKVVFLDASRMCEHWQMGILCNTFPRRVANLVDDFDDPNLVVINSADMGQDAWIEPEQSCTAFGRIVASTLAGGGTSSSWFGRVLGWSDITLRDLEAEIRTELLTWSQRERGAFQTAVTHYAGEELPDWKLADSAGKSVTDVDRQGAIDELRTVIKVRAEELGNMWAKMDTLASKSWYVQDPLAWASLQNGLAQLERLMVAGKKYDQEYVGLKSRVDLRLDGLLEPDDGASADSPDSPPIASFPLAQQWHRKSSAVELSDLRSKWAVKQDPGDKTWDSLSYLDAVDIGLNWLEEAKQSNRSDMESVISLVDRCRGGRSCDVVEIQFLKMLARDAPTRDALRLQINAAMKNRFAAEQAVTPADPRALYWVEDLVQRTDITRRQVEDLVLFGDGEQQASLDQLARDYQTAVTIGDKISHALRIRDRAFAEIPHLALWKLRSARAQVSQNSGETFASLLGLVRQAHELDQELADREGNWQDAIEQQVARLQDELNRLRGEYDSTAHAILRDDAKDGESIHRINVILAAPLRCGASGSTATNLDLSRGDILRLYAQLLFEHQTTQTKPAAEVPKILGEMRRWNSHPLVAVLDAALGSGTVQPSAGELDDLHWETQEQATRKRLKTENPKKLEDALAAAVRLLRVNDTDPTLNSHRSLVEAETIYRRSAPVASVVLEDTRSQNHQLNPPRLNRQIAQLRQLLRQQRRTLEDCYLAAQQQGTFVQLANEGYRRAAEEKVSEISRGLPRGQRFYEDLHRVDDVDLKTLANVRTRATGLLASSDRIRLKEDDPQINPDINQTVPHTIEVPEALDVPADGKGFLELTLSNGNPFDVEVKNSTTAAHRYAFPTRQDPRQLVCTMDRTSLTDVREVLVRSYFRGGWHGQSIPVRVPNKGIEIIHARPSYPDPRVTVRGDARKPALIVFVLDCSASMKDKLPGQEGSTTKMSQAQAALVKILEDLVRYQEKRRGEYRVGLVLYGHRARWPKGIASDNPDDIAIQDGYADKSIHPNNDIEAVKTTLELLSADTLADLQKRIDALQPFGVTPLYGSLKTAINLIANAQGSKDACFRHVIAITDGVNETPATNNREYQVSADSVKQLANEEDVQIDIVKFDVQFNEKYADRMSRTDFDERLAEMTDIAQSSLGRTYIASAPAKLTEVLRDATAPARFAVETKTPGQDVYQAGGDVALGETWIHTKWSGGADEGRLEVVDPQQNSTATANVLLEGGEHLYMVYDGSRLVHDPFDTRDLQDQDPRDDVDGGRFYVSALVPEWTADELLLRVMLRNRNVEEFSPRPKHVWAEVTPVGEEQSKFVFYDLEFESDVSVPILHFRTLDWPTHIGQAEIKLWFVMHNLAQEPNFDKAIGDLDPGQRYSIGIEGVEIEVEERRLEKTGERQFVVWEYYDDSRAKQMPVTRVQMTPTPANSEHEYRYADGNVRHVFRYSDQSRLTVPRLQIMAKDRIVRATGAISIPGDPIRVTLPRRNR